jgi:hypothetical protein
MPGYARHTYLWNAGGKYAIIVLQRRLMMKGEK